MSFRRQGGGTIGPSQAGNITDLDLTGKGAPPEMIGMSAFTKGVGGGVCPACGQFANVLYADGKCAKHTGSLPNTPPRTCTGGDERENKDCNGGGCRGGNCDK